jgi:hypothetical protein
MQAMVYITLTKIITIINTHRNITITLITQLHMATTIILTPKGMWDSMSIWNLGILGQNHRAAISKVGGTTVEGAIAEICGF